MNPRPGFICVVVDDMARSLTFYEYLGFKFPVEAYGEVHVEVELPGGLQIYWDCTQQWASRYAPDYRPGPHGRVALGFKVDSAGDVDALFTKLKKFGYKVDRTPWDAPWGVRYAMVYDPDGNLVEIYSPRPLRSKDAPGEGAHSDPGGGGGAVTVYRVFHRRFDAYHNPDDRQGVSTRDRAATWDDRAEAEAVAARLNERDRHPEYGELGDDDWVVVDDT